MSDEPLLLTTPKIQRRYWELIAREAPWMLVLYLLGCER